MKRIIFITVAYIIFISAFCWGTIINIPQDYPTIQTGINAGTNGDTVLVHPGTYVENVNFNGHNIVLGSLFLTTGDTSYISATIIDGDSAGTVVTFDQGENNTAIITGLTIQNGYVIGPGGIRCSYSSPTINKNIIRGNITYGAAGGGGGIGCISSSAIIIDNIIYGNSTEFDASGGGINCSSSSPFISKNIISDNSGYWGGGICCVNSDPIISGNIIIGNSADDTGGGICCVDAATNIANNIIRGNTSASYGGGIGCWRDSLSVIRNNIILDNFAPYGGGISFRVNSAPNVTNNIFWANSINEIHVNNSSPVITYCDIEGGWPGEANINVDPLFIEPDSGDFHLMSIACGDSIDSPCIDSGSPHIGDSLLDCSWGLGTIASDMGAYGGGDTIIVNTNIIINVPGDYPTIQLAINACNDGDTVLVQPDIYYENINFDGYNIVVGSMFIMTGDNSYISSTIIDGSDSASVITFNSGEDSTASIIGFTIQSGSANHGGGIYCYNSDPAISYNIIKDNYVYSFGGGILFLESASILNNNLILDNSANQGGGICCMESSPTIINNVLAGNTGSMSGGGVYCNLESYPSIINTILWADSAPAGLEIDHDGLSSPSVTYCDIQGGWTGIGNIDMDPLFRDSSAGDFHIMSMACSDTLDSPCIDAGHPDLVDILLDCSWGLGGSRSDMGAYGGGDFPMTAISDEYLPAPRKLMLNQNYPNPFNVQTAISFDLHGANYVRLIVYDLLGRQVQTLIDEYLLAGSHTVTFDASYLSSGVYFYRLQAGEMVETKRMVLLK
ncbi:MAG: right-handed parallel beta-helix repeat-containing protein [Candidatus Zixiibacteriota bacterium]|nr:MAG: right-handed parallel beta-helix repeat-containing protein [candidate division Zixibacteria bacterium]